MNCTFTHRLVLTLTGALLATSLFATGAPVAADDLQAGAIQNTSSSTSSLDKDDPSDSRQISNVTATTIVTSAPINAAVTEPLVQQTAPFVGSGTQTTYIEDRN